jgi:hypothetical protein
LLWIILTIHPKNLSDESESSPSVIPTDFTFDIVIFAIRKDSRMVRFDNCLNAYV